MSWAGFHTFRHTCASLLLAQGRNVKQVQRWLSHHAASFTLDTYAHLLDEGIGGALDLGAELGVESGFDARLVAGLLDGERAPSQPGSGVEGHRYTTNGIRLGNGHPRLALVQRTHL